MLASTTCSRYVAITAPIVRKSTKNNAVLVLALYTPMGVGLGTPVCLEASSNSGSSMFSFSAEPAGLSPRAIQIALASYSSAGDTSPANHPQFSVIPVALSETSRTDNGNYISIAAGYAQADSADTWAEVFAFPGGPEDGHGWLTCVIPEPE